jgi:uncharacterized phage protein gp47/JayE
MPFDLSTPQAVRDRLSSEFETLAEGADPRNRRSVEAALVRANAIAGREFSGHVAWIFKQLFPDTCDDEYLPRHANLCRPPVTRREALTGSGRIVLTGTVGTTLPAATEYRRSDDLRFITQADATIGVGGSIEVEVLPTSAGSASNCAVGTRLTALSPSEGIASVALVAATGVTGGTDIETPDSWRARIIERRQEPADGGNDADWRQWVQEVTGKTKVWVYPHHMGLGTVGITFIMPDGSVPAGGDLAAVEDHLEVVRPVTAEPIVFAPVVSPVDFEIRLTPENVATKAAITAELADFFIREAEPSGTTPLSRISAAISAAIGEFSHEIISPVVAITPAAGHIARLGNIDWVA